jgi:hypothetical protein
MPPAVVPADLALREVSVRDVNRPITETISHAPARFAAWNITVSWHARWRLRLTTRPQPKLEVVVRLYSTVSDAQKRAWEEAIVAKWDNRFAFCVKKDPLPAGAAGASRYSEVYPIRVLIAWLPSAEGADYTIVANAAGARVGLGGTTGMTGWGTADRTDITHEFGHILGCPEEYFTTNGVDYAALYGGEGFRVEGAGVMNNPAGPALARNFDVIRGEAATLRSVPADRTEIA